MNRIPLKVSWIILSASIAASANPGLRTTSVEVEPLGITAHEAEERAAARVREIEAIEKRHAGKRFIGVAVTLSGGGRLDGVLAGYDEETVTLEIGGGTVGFLLANVDAVEAQRNKWSVFREKEADPSDARALWRLARWAESRELGAYARQTARRLLALAPDHAGARSLLGHERIGGVWLTHAEAMRAKGYVNRGGSWITQAEHREIQEERRRSEDARLLEARFRQEADLERERRRRVEAELRRKKARRRPRTVYIHRHHPGCGHHIIRRQPVRR